MRTKQISVWKKQITVKDVRKNKDDEYDYTSVSESFSQNDGYPTTTLQMTDIMQPTTQHNTEKDIVTVSGDDL